MLKISSSISGEKSSVKPTDERKVVLQSSSNIAISGFRGVFGRLEGSVAHSPEIQTENGRVEGVPLRPIRNICDPKLSITMQ
jgi:hypothetical protein